MLCDGRKLLAWQEDRRKEHRVLFPSCILALKADFWIGPVFYLHIDSSDNFKERLCDPLSTGKWKQQHFTGKWWKAGGRTLSPVWMENHHNTYGRDGCIICGYYTDSVPVSAYSYACIEGAKQVLAAGQNAEITLKMGRWCSYPRWFMEKLAQRRDLTIHLQFEYLHKQYEVLIPAKTPMDTECEWYGPLKLCNLYPYTIK